MLPTYSISPKVSLKYNEPPHSSSPSSTTGGGGENGDSSGGVITDEAIQRTIDSLVRFLQLFDERALIFWCAGLVIVTGDH